MARQEFWAAYVPDDAGEQTRAMIAELRGRLGHLALETPRRHRVEDHWTLTLRLQMAARRFAKRHGWRAP
jgi:hypothetical protein